MSCQAVTGASTAYPFEGCAASSCGFFSRAESYISNSDALVDQMPMHSRSKASGNSSLILLSIMPVTSFVKIRLNSLTLELSRAA